MCESNNSNTYITLRTKMLRCTAKKQGYKRRLYRLQTTLSILKRGCTNPKRRQWISCKLRGTTKTRWPNSKTSKPKQPKNNSRSLMLSLDWHLKMIRMMCRWPQSSALDLMEPRPAATSNSPNSPKQRMIVGAESYTRRASHQN